MFRKSKTEKQLNFQTSVSQHLEGSAYKQYSDTTSWQNIFLLKLLQKLMKIFFRFCFQKRWGHQIVRYESLLQ